MLINIVLLIMFLSAAAAIFLRNLTHSIYALIITGLCLCLSLFLLGSHELAFIQLSIELAIVFILIRSTSNIAEKDSYSKREMVTLLVSSLSLAAILFLAFESFDGLIRTETLPAEIISKNLGLLQLAGVTAVIIAAIIGVITILRPKAREKE
ncbi:MAG: hypothetical protein WC890_05820 [Candidatus Margulisiibacteriota bacterium]